MSDEEVTFNLELNVIKLTNNLQKIERILLGILRVLRKLGLPEEIDAAIIRVQRMITTVQLLHASLIAVSSTNPYTAIFGVIGAISTGLTVGDMLAGY